jgi:hypothetical protein
MARIRSRLTERNYSAVQSDRRQISNAAATAIQCTTVPVYASAVIGNGLNIA